MKHLSINRVSQRVKERNGFLYYLGGRKYSQAIDFVGGQEIVGFFTVTVTIVHVRIGNNDFFRTLRPSAATKAVRTYCC